MELCGSIHSSALSAKMFRMVRNRFVPNRLKLYGLTEREKLKNVGGDRREIII